MKSSTTGSRAVNASLFANHLQKWSSSGNKSPNDEALDHRLPYNFGNDYIKVVDQSQDLLDLCSGNFDDAMMAGPGPAKSVSVLGKLLDQQETQDSESQVSFNCLERKIVLSFSSDTSQTQILI